MDKMIVLCPFCVKEQRVGVVREIVRCERCGKPINNDIFANTHPEEFWSNPDTCARF